MEGRRQFFDSIIQFGWITSEHAKRKLNTYPESDRRMRVMLSARTLFRRCRSRPGKNFSVRRVCDRPWGATEIPRQSFYSSRPDVTLLSTPFETARLARSCKAQYNTRRIRNENEAARAIYLHFDFTRNENPISHICQQQTPKRPSVWTAVTHFPRQ